MKKKLIILAICLLALLITGVYLYAKTDALDVFLPEGIRNQREMERLENLLPSTIGEYLLVPYGLKRVNLTRECAKVPNAPDDVSGFCNQLLHAEYRDEKTGKTVFVNLVKALEGRESFINYLTKIIINSHLNNYQVFRIELHELGWFPVSEKFDVLVTQEGVWHSNPDGGGFMSYKEKANGQNPVTEYLLMTYLPEELSPLYIEDAEKEANLPGVLD